MSPITTHVLDTRLGRPAEGIPVTLDRLHETARDERWDAVAVGVTNSDGRLSDLIECGPFEAGTYRLTFSLAQYFEAQQVEYFYPEVTVTFNVVDATKHYHVPLLLSPFGYSTYRGS